MRFRECDGGIFIRKVVWFSACLCVRGDTFFSRFVCVMCRRIAERRFNEAFRWYNDVSAGAEKFDVVRR